MTIRKAVRRGETRLVIDIPYRTADGRRLRFRRDAQLQTRCGAEAEHRRLIAELNRTGTLENVCEPEETKPPDYTFDDAVKRFRASHMQTALKPSTRDRYERLLNKLLVPRFGSLPLGEISGNALIELDAELVSDELAPATRRNVHIAFRSVLRCAAESGLLESVPKMPKLPTVGRKHPREVHRDDIETVLEKSSVSARLALGLAAFAGLRASEVRGLRWTDVDLKSRTVTVRRALTLGEETTPKSHHQRPIPIATPLFNLLTAAASKKHKPSAPVAVTAKGERWGESGLNQALKQAQKRADKSGWSFHDLRHFFATELFRRGASAPVVQQLLGHSELSTTQRYADMVASDRRAAIALFDGNCTETA